MGVIGFAILIGSLALSVLIAVATHGHVLFFFLPLIFGLPIAGLFSRRRP
ncbi:MAG: hypothetical protein JWO83_969 [Caulobacteraceae bacterium]|jgi:hypothetical protein|nr:hypothetical protein [Caulobacteraceae bacterium]